tara:strand:+ start:179 stop:1045 length:867 start_codon:yes stop_codon:yes gene_type:complete
MNFQNNDDSKTTWRIWLIKKLLINYKNKDDILKILSESSEIDIKNNQQEIDDNNENKLIKNIFNLSEKSVEDVMVPRAEIIAIEKNQNIKDILPIIEKESHSRMPVYEQNLDNIFGFVHIKDVIKNIKIVDFKIDQILREVLYVAPKSPVLDLLKRMRVSRIHMGLVVDEFGGVDGLVTIEDLIEEIVGEIEDEHDAEDYTNLQKINESKIIVNASYKLTDLEKYFDIQMEKQTNDEIDTVGGLVFYLAGKVPKKAEIFDYNTILKLKVLSASERRINTLQIEKIQKN